MADKSAHSLLKMNSASKRGNDIEIRSSYMSLTEMINMRRDEYPSLADLDAYNCCNKFHDDDVIKNYNKTYEIKTPYRLVKAGPGDRPCHWRPNGPGLSTGRIQIGLS